MTKAERAKMDSLVEKVRLNGALRWTSEVKPDVLPPTDQTVLVGYLAYGSIGWGYMPRVDKAWTQFHLHGDGDGSNSRFVSSHGGRAMYSSKLLAVKAKRHQMELECAKILAAYDKLIEELETELDSTK
jgi:hypothetical protein